MGFGRFVLRARPLLKREKDFLECAKKVVSTTNYEKVLRFTKDYSGIPDYAKLHTIIAGDVQIPYFRVGRRDEKEEIMRLNKLLKEGAVKELFKTFGEKSTEQITNLIAPHIIGHSLVKKSCVLQLFSDKLHILLLGDPGTGKTDIMRSTATYSPIAQFGLGSGTTNVGLIVTVKGDEVQPGLLPLAHGGVCALDELNLLKEDSRAGLYNAMEKGFVTYDKGGHHFQFDANVRILAAANPKGDKFRGETASALKRQLPFDPALLSRFHLVHTIRGPSVQEFEKIARGVTEREQKETLPGDIELLKTFIESMRTQNPELTQEVKEAIIMIAKDIKEREEDLLIEVSPRIVHGLKELVIASARIEQRNEANMKDAETAREILLQSLKV